MRTVAIVQARMGSSRLPGKVLMDLGARTVLARVVHRVRRAALVHDTVVATSSETQDDAVVAECRRLGVKYFRGSERDVLDRYYQCAQAHMATIVVRITADCPLIDKDVVDAVIRSFLENACDYACNTGYPRGLDVEVLTIEALACAWREASKPYEREHVTPYIYEHPEHFRLRSINADADYSQYRWTVDTLEDLELLRLICARLAEDEDFGWRDVLRLMRLEPELLKINQHVVQRALHA
jgi:spore coat polysaccharide biosynthesis protein SpsF